MVLNSELSGQTALVTGSAGAIGLCIVEHLIARGVKVFMSSSPDSAEQLRNLSQKFSNQIVGSLAIDLADKDNCSHLFTMAQEASEHKKIEILINCAGISIDNLFLRVSDEEWKKQFDINLNSSWYMTKIALKHMMHNRYGRVVSISSVIGHIGNPGQVAYAATKSALYGMTRTLAKEVATRGVTVNTVSPGFIESPMTQKLMQNEEMFKKVLSNIPVGYIGKPQDVASTVSFLVSPSASYITGIDIPVCGGMYMN